MQIDFKDKSEFGLKVLKYMDAKGSELIYKGKRLYFYDHNIPNYGKRCFAKGREVEEKDIIEYFK